MNEMEFETQLRSIARGMDYPLTPDIAGSVAARLRTGSSPRFASRPLARSIVLALVLLASLMLIPPVRAAVVEFIQIGIVRIFRADPTPVPEQDPSTLVPLTATPGSTLPPLIPLLEEMAGEMSLAEAQRMLPYPILLPAYPAELGEPDRVFVQDAEGFMTILVWIDPQQPDQVRMSLHLIPEGSWAIEKGSPRFIQETEVNGRWAIWAEGAYPLRLFNGELQYRRMVEGHVLIWEQAGITYRLETEASLEEAIRIAESLEPIP